MQEFMKKAQYWASSFPTLCIFNSNGFQDPYSAFSMMITIGKKDSFRSNGENTYKDLQGFINQNPHNFIIGYFSYDLKNESPDSLLNLNANVGNSDNHKFPHTFFYIPEIILKFTSTNVEIITEDPSSIID